jgi:hypothetical protein
MKYSLSVTVGNGPAICVTAEADLGEDLEHGCPDSFEGHFIDVPLEKLLDFTDRQHNAQVGFRGGRYHLERLEKDRAFKLRRGKSK